MSEKPSCLNKSQEGNFLVYKEELLIISISEYAMQHRPRICSLCS